MLCFYYSYFYAISIIISSIKESKNVFFVIAINIFPFYAYSQVDFNDLNETKGIIDLYKKCQTMGYIWNEIKPVVSVPAVIGYEAGRTAMGDLCYSVTQMKNYTGKLQNLSEKLDYENVTDDGFKLKMALAAYNYNQANSEMDVNDEKNSSSSVIRYKSRKKYDSFYRRITGVTSDNPESLNDLETLSKLNSRRAALGEKLQCKEGRNENIKKRFEQELAPIENKIMELDEIKQFYKSELETLGGKFKREKDMDGFREEFKNLDKTSIQLIPKDRYLEIDSFQKIKASSGENKKKPIKTQILIQEFSVNELTGVIRNFEEKWNSNWKDNLDDQSDMLLESLNKGTRCGRISDNTPTNGSGIDRAKDYADFFNSNCSQKNKITKRTAGGLFSKNFKKYIEAFRELRKNEARALSIESELLMEQVYPSKDSTKNNISKFEEPCAVDLTEADMSRLALEFNKADTEYRQITAEAKYKKIRIKEERLKKEKNDRKILNSKIDLHTRKNKEDLNRLKKIPKSTSF